MQYVINSLEVATATGMSHNNLMRKIRGSSKDIAIISRIEDLGQNVEDYMIPSGFADENGKIVSGYIFTKLGYDFLLNTFIGDRGARLSDYYARKTNGKDE